MPLRSRLLPLFVAALLPGLAGPAPAQTAALATPAGCERLARLIWPGQDGGLHAGPAATEVVGGDACLFRRVRFPTGQVGGYRADVMLVRGLPLDAPPGPMPSASVQVELRGLTFVLSTGNPATDWVSNAQQMPFDALLDAGYEAPTGRLVVRSLTLDGPGLGHVALALEVDHLALTLPLDSLEHVSFEAASLVSLRLDLQSRRALLGFVLPWLIAALPDEAPGPVVERAKVQAAAELRARLPAAGLSRESIEALATFVLDWPKPQHGLSLSASFVPPLASRDLPDSKDPVELARVLLPRLRGTATYTGLLP